jgi:hypothetical protein
VLLEAAKRYCDDPQVHQGFGKHPATWLNKKCWLDEDRPPPTPPPTANGIRKTNYTDEEYGNGW